MSGERLFRAAPNIAGLAPYRPGGDPAALARRYGLSELTALASNENPLGPGARARAALRRLPPPGRYPDGDGRRLKQALADRHGVAPEQITLGNGSSETLELAIRVLAGPGLQVVYPRYSFIVYALATQAQGAEAVASPVRDWGCDPGALAAAVGPHTRLVLIANPNNPTGTWLPAAELRRLLELLPAHVTVVVDEAYAEYVEAPGYASCIAWIADFPRLAVTRTFSKVHGLAGLRVGYAVSHPELTDLMNRARQPFNVNAAALAAAQAALEDTDHIARSISLNRAGREQWAEAGARLGLRCISSQGDSQGNFVTLDLERPSGPVFEALLRAGVLTRPLEEYRMPQHLRVTIGREEENRRCIAALQRALER
ncbi:MAG: histidinol-phosphate transaminase [Gammaproteobacteria bacterium]|nr:histidinol-phosphate transaminase [Gammaproteobacteria bacterium]